jgi:hypothetical protein
MAAEQDLRLLEDARWDPERECVEVTAFAIGADGPRYLRCIVSLEALETLVATPSPLDPLRLLRDFEARIAAAAGRKAAAGVSEVVVTARDLRK